MAPGTGRYTDADAKDAGQTREEIAWTNVPPLSSSCRSPVHLTALTTLCRYTASTTTVGEPSFPLAYRR